MPLRFRILAGSDAAAERAAESGPTVDRTVDVADGLTEVRFGRREGLEVTLPFSALSGVHARLLRQNDQFTLEDMGSRNGSGVGEQDLPPHGRASLRPGERFRLANVWILFEGAVAVPSRVSEGTGTLARRLVSDLFAGRSGGAEVARLKVADGPDAGRDLRLEVADRAYLVGRGPGCDLMLTAGDLSREHASFTRRWEGVFVRDLGSKNGVAVAGQRIDGEHHLRDGDRLSMGAVNFTFEDPEDRYLREMEASGATGVALTAPPTVAAVVEAIVGAGPPAVASTTATPSWQRNLIIAVAAAVLVGAAALLVSLLLS